MLSRLERFSSWMQAKLAVANCIRYVRKLREMARNRNGTSSSISVEDMKNAELVIIKWMQHDCYAKEIKLLQQMEADNDHNDRECIKKKQAVMKKSSGIYMLDPFLDCDGVLRVGGRLSRVDMSKDVKHPIILPRKCHMTTLIIWYFHAKVQHSGRGIILNEVRASGYWIVNGNTAVRSVIAKCIRCRYPLASRRW